MGVIMTRKKILYIMGIDWDWIYQRPQILAEELARDYDVTAVFPRSILQAGKKRKSKHELTKDKEQTPGNVPAKDKIQLETTGVITLLHRILWTLPYQEKTPVLGAIANSFHKRIFRDIHSFDYIYIGYPLYARYIPENYRGKIIYDCLDDFEALYPDQKRVCRVTEQEQCLLKRCDLMLVSSSHLQKRAEQLTDASKLLLLRNATKGFEKLEEIKPAQNKKSYSLCYIGTISEWMDYPLLEESLDRVEDISYHLIGPVVKRVDQEQIHYEGVVEHAKLQEAIRDYDCLIMPFVVNDIVLAVDPVKLYEYIAFGKCIISVYYPEVEQFGDFVYFYRTAEEYVELLERLKQQGFPPKYTAEQQRNFLEENTWSKRYERLHLEIQRRFENNVDGR